MTVIPTLGRRDEEPRSELSTSIGLFLDPIVLAGGTSAVEETLYQVDATPAPSGPGSNTTELSAAASLEQDDSKVSECSVSPPRRSLLG